MVPVVWVLSHAPGGSLVLQSELFFQRDWRLRRAVGVVPRGFNLEHQKTLRHSLGDYTSYFSKYSTPNNNRSHPLSGGFAPHYFCSPIQFQPKKMSNGNFWKQKIYKFLPICLCKLHFLFICSFVFMCMLYLCVSTLTVEVRSQCWVSSFVFLHLFICLLLRQGLSLDLELTNWLDWLNSYVCLLILN